MQVSESITRRSASNLALAFVMLPREKRRAMSALYAFCREVDDVADDDGRSVADRREALGRWREDIGRACSGREPELAVNRELQGPIERFGLPLELFEELLVGVESDLETWRYETQAELEGYCYRVASVVGLLSIEIFGYSDPRCREYAVALGKALQLTNILRDVRNDAERGRIYLPGEALRRHGVSPEAILRLEYSPAFRRSAEELAGIARGYYREARELLPPEDRRSMVAAELMGTVYWRLLRRLESVQFNVFGDRLARVSRGEKVWLILRSWIRHALRVPAASYGSP